MLMSKGNITRDPTLCNKRREVGEEKRVGSSCRLIFCDFFSYVYIKLLRPKSLIYKRGIQYQNIFLNKNIAREYLGGVESPKFEK